MTPTLPDFFAQFLSGIEAMKLAATNMSDTARAAAATAATSIEEAATKAADDIQRNHEEIRGTIRDFVEFSMAQSNLLTEDLIAMCHALPRSVPLGACEGETGPYPPKQENANLEAILVAADQAADVAPAYPTEAAKQWAKENGSSWIPDVAPHEAPVRVDDWKPSTMMDEFRQQQETNAEQCEFTDDMSAFTTPEETPTVVIDAREKVVIAAPDSETQEAVAALNAPEASIDAPGPMERAVIEEDRWRAEIAVGNACMDAIDTNPHGVDSRGYAAANPTAADRLTEILAPDTADPVVLAEKLTADLHHHDREIASAACSPVPAPEPPHEAKPRGKKAKKHR